jgi:hypothetical protein
VLSALTILDDFEGGEGRFTWAPFASSGSTNGITAASVADHTDVEAHAGVGSQRIVIVRDESPSGRLRHVSGGGSPLNNRVEIGGDDYALGPQGFVGFFLKTTDADLQVGVGVDDGTSTGATGLEVSTSLPVIADGKWHLYEWNLGDAGQWENFSGGNGAIGGPNAYVDSIFVYGGENTAGESFEVFLDTVAYNPHGSLASLGSTAFRSDFNRDGRVDSRDLLKWRGDFGATAHSDSDGDGDSDGGDFLAWQRQAGGGVGAGSSSTPAAGASLSQSAVPEPTMLVWAVAGLAVLAGMRVR